MVHDVGFISQPTKILGVRAADIESGTEVLIRWEDAKKDDAAWNKEMSSLCNSEISP